MSSADGPVYSKVYCPKCDGTLNDLHLTGINNGPEGITITGTVNCAECGVVELTIDKDGCEV